MATAPLSSEQATCPQPRKTSDINDKSQDEPPPYLSQTIPKQLSASDRRGVGYVRLWPIVLRSVLLKQISTWANFPTCVNNMFRPTFGVCVCSCGCLCVLVACRCGVFRLFPCSRTLPPQDPHPKLCTFSLSRSHFRSFFLSREVFSWNCCRDSRIWPTQNARLGSLTSFCASPFWR